MKIKVRRKAGALKINRYSTADHPSLEFPDNEDVFEIPISYLQDLDAYFEPFFPPTKDEEEVKTFMLGGSN